MRIGIFGGTFDPVHLGHLILAEQCREQCELDEIWFIPASLPPHKLDAKITPANARCDMLEFALAGNPHFKISRIELDRSGPSYTVTTLEQIHAEDPTRQLFLLVGADSIRDLPTWRQPARIVELATIVAVNRVLTPSDSAACPSSDDIPIPPQRIRQVQMPGIDISATDIRQRARTGRSLRYLVPRAVEAYISQHGLYGD